jgi:hypothetical protein
LADARRAIQGTLLKMACAPIVKLVRVRTKAGAGTGGDVWLARLPVNRDRSKMPSSVAANAPSDGRQRYSPAIWTRGTAEERPIGQFPEA